VLGCLSLVKIVLTTLGMKDYRVRVGLRDPDSAKYTGTAENWNKAEEACRQAARTLGVPFTEEPGEAAFYGPKIDFVIKDVIGREWQLGTVQVDYNLPIRFDLSYVGADNKPHRPVMIHRAPFGSMERFCGVLIEHFAGDFPVWLAPEQVRILPISEKVIDACDALYKKLKDARVRVSLTPPTTSSAPRSAAPSWTGSLFARARPEGGRGAQCLRPQPCQGRRGSAQAGRLPRPRSPGDRHPRAPREAPRRPGPRAAGQAGLTDCSPVAGRRSRSAPPFAPRPAKPRGYS
jgi:hypothetical protein